MYPVSLTLAGLISVIEHDHPFYAENDTIRFDLQ